VFASKRGRREGVFFCVCFHGFESRREAGGEGG